MNGIEQLVELLHKHAADVDTNARFPVEALTALRTTGYLGLLVPREFGGMGQGLAELTDVARQLAGACLSTAMIWAMHCQQVDVIVRHARSPLRESLLRRIAAGEVYLGSITTEAGKGGYLLTAHAAVTNSGGMLQIDRAAPVVTGGAHADGFLITMRASAEARNDEVSLIYADRGDLDIEQSRTWETLGMRGTESVALKLRGRVGSENLVGRPGGFREAATDSMVPIGHLAWSACWLGAAQAVFSALIRQIVSGSAQNIRVDISSPLTQERIARIRLDLELVGAYLSMVQREIGTARAGDGRLNNPAIQIHLNTLKIAASELTFQAIDRMMQLAGLANGYRNRASVPIERVFRDLRSAALNYGNDRLLAANGLLSLADRRVTLI
ncbi:acyl-CoA dehydrogenase family protein [Nonomuraea sp. NPDC004297]